MTTSQREGTGRTLARWTVFLSSVFQELKAYRLAIGSELEQPEWSDVKAQVRMTDLVYTPGYMRRPEDLCTDKIRGSDLVVFLVGRRIGSVIPGRVLTYTELEIAVSEDQGIPWFWFEIPADASDVRRDERGHAAHNIDGRTLERMRRRLTAGAQHPGTGVSHSGPTELARSVMGTLQHWLAEEAKPLHVGQDGGSRVAMDRFVNRATEYRKLREAVDHRVTIVTGAPGTGKSTITSALEFDPGIRQSYFPILRVPTEEDDLRPVTIAQSVYTGLAAESGITEPPALTEVPALRSAIAELVKNGKPGRTPIVVLDLTQVWRRPDRALPDGRTPGPPVASGAEIRPETGGLVAGIDILPPSVHLVVETTDPLIEKALQRELSVPPSRVVVLPDFEPEHGMAILRSMGALCPIDVIHGYGELCPDCSVLARRLCAHLSDRPILLAVAGGFLKPCSQTTRHKELVAVETRISDEAGLGPEYLTIKTAFGHLTRTQREILVLSSMLLTKPYPLPVAMLSFLRSGASLEEWEGAGGGFRRGEIEKTIADLEALEARRLVEPAPPVIGAPTSVDKTGDYPTPKPGLSVHPLVAMVVKRIAADEPAWGTDRLKDLQAAAIEYCDGKLQHMFDEASYVSWYSLERAETQEHILTWLFLTTNDFDRTDDVRSLLEVVVRLYLQAHWWWGLYISFELCSRVIDVLDRRARALPSDPYAMSDTALERRRRIVAVSDALSAFDRAFPKEGNIITPIPDRERVTRWLEVRRQIVALASALELPLANSTDGPPAEELTDTRAEIAQYLHVFMAHALVRGSREQPVPRATLSEAERHYRTAFDLAGSETPPDWWNQMFYSAECGAAWLEGGCPAEARQWATEEVADLHDLNEGSENIDFEARSLIERVIGDAAWLEGHHRQAFTRYIRAVYYALCFQSHPHPADPYTGCFLMEQEWRLAVHLRELVGLVAEGEVPRTTLDPVVTDLCRAFGSDDAEVRVVIDQVPADMTWTDLDTMSAVFGSLYVSPAQGPLYADWMVLRDQTDEMISCIERIRGMYPDLKLIPPARTT